VKAVSAAYYAAFVSAYQAGPASPAAGSPEANGQNVFKQAGCSGCHAIGAGPKGAVLIGPNLTHFGGRGTIAGAVLTNRPQNLAEWILHAQDVKPGADMPSFDGSALPTYPKLSQSQVDDLVAYLESLK
jgi:cytochrome c oxidase subunit 2